MLIFRKVPQQGGLEITTEFGKMVVDPGFICVIQRGMKFAVHVNGGSRGYIAEIFKGHFGIPERGPMGIYLTCSFNFANHV
jgi:homogentisate 1,2-dioxygenase